MNPWSAVTTTRPPNILLPNPWSCHGRQRPNACLKTAPNNHFPRPTEEVSSPPRRLVSFSNVFWRFPYYLLRVITTYYSLLTTTHYYLILLTLLNVLITATDRYLILHTAAYGDFLLLNRFYVLAATCYWLRTDLPVILLPCYCIRQFLLLNTTTTTTAQSTNHTYKLLLL